MEFEWDPRKARLNRLKHRVAFADAVSVFGDDSALTVRQPHEGEDRFVTLGTDLFGRLLGVAYVHRGTRLRLISARSATPRERRQYES